jgi:hypothetical protein
MLTNWSAALVRVFPSAPRNQAAVCARPCIGEGQAARICFNSDLVNSFQPRSGIFVSTISDSVPVVIVR